MQYTMVQYYCKAPLFGLPECSLYRRTSWGVCKSCWRTHIENNDKMQELYNTRWSENIRLSYNKEDNDWHSSPQAPDVVAELSQGQPGAPLMQAAGPYKDQKKTIAERLGLTDKACERSESESSRTTEWRRDFRIMENRQIQKDVTSSPPPPPSAKRQHSRPSSGAPSQSCPVGASDIPEPEHEQPRRKEKRSDMRSRSPKPERLQPRRKERRSSPHHRKSDGPCEGLQLSAAPRHLREELKALSGTAIRQLVIDLMMELERRSER